MNVDYSKPINIDDEFIKKHNFIRLDPYTSLPLACKDPNWVTKGWSAIFQVVKNHK